MIWVQDWVQLRKEEWLRFSCKRHQIGHLDFQSFRLLTEGLLVPNLVRGAKFLKLNCLRNVILAFCFPKIIVSCKSAGQ